MTDNTWRWATLDERGLELVQEAERTIGADSPPRRTCPIVLVYAEGAPRTDGRTRAGLARRALDAPAGVPAGHGAAARRRRGRVPAGLISRAPRWPTVRRTGTSSSGPATGRSSSAITSASRTRSVDDVGRARMQRRTDRPVGRSPTHARQDAPTMPRPDPAEQSRSRRERILDAAFSTFATPRLPRDGGGRHRRRRGDVQGRHLLPLPDQGSDLPRADVDDRGQARRPRWSGRSRSRPSRSRAPRRRSTPCSRAFAGHRTMARLLFLDTVGAGRVFQTETNALHERFARLIQGYLDEAVAAGAVPADGHADHEHRLVRGDQRGGRAAGCWPTSRAASRTRTRRCGRPCSGARACPAERIGEVPLPHGRLGLPGAGAVTAVHPPGPGGAAPAPGDAAAGLGERLAGLLDAAGRRRHARRRDGAGRRRSTRSRSSPRPSRPTSRSRSGSARPRARPSSASGARGRRSPPGPDRFREAEAAWRDADRRCAASTAAGRTRRGPARSSSAPSGSPGGRPPRTTRGARSGRARWSCPELLLAVTPDGASLTGSLAGPVAPADVRGPRAPLGPPGRPRARPRAQPQRHGRDAGLRAPRHRRRAADPRPLAPAGRHVLGRRRARAHRQGGARPPRRACAPRWSSTSPTPCGASPPAPPRARPTRSGAAGGRSWAPPRSASSAPRAARSGPSPSPGRSAAAPMPPRTRQLGRALLASEKDREEHAIVVVVHPGAAAPGRRHASTVAPEPGVMTLRFVQHLVTEISGTVPDAHGLLALGERLHPTPAVGGEPRDVALALLDEHEGFDRGWYAGPVGWLGADGDGELCVALRCGIVDRTRATLFAGCGIVADSDPDQEWEESRIKLRAVISRPGHPGGRAMSDAAGLRAFVAELVAAGVREAVVCPGSRSTPLALALRTARRAPGPGPARRAGGRASSRWAWPGRRGRPVVLLATSGTAVVEFAPGRGRGAALAGAAGGADRGPAAGAARPRRAPDDRPGAPVRAGGEVVHGAAAARRRSGDRWRTGGRSRAGRSPMAAEGPAGPVQVNVPFREPLLPDGPLATRRRGDAAGAARRSPRSIGRAAGRSTTTRSTRSAARLAGRARGPDRRRARTTTRRSPRPSPRSPRATGFPILADPLSGLRTGPHDRTLVVARGGPARPAGPVARRAPARPRHPDRRHAHVQADRRAARAGPPGADRPRRGRRLARGRAAPGDVRPRGPGRRRPRALRRAAVGPGAAAPRLDRATGSTADRAADAAMDRWLAALDEPFEGAPVAGARRRRCRTAPSCGPAARCRSATWTPGSRPRTARSRVRSNRGANGIDGVVSTALGLGGGGRRAGRARRRRRRLPPRPQRPGRGAAPRPVGHDRARQQRRRRHLLVPAPGAARGRRARHRACRSTTRSCSGRRTGSTSGRS